MPLRTERHSWLKIAFSLLVAAQVAGCSTAPKQGEVAVEDEKAAAELSELFAGIGEETTSGEQPESAAEQKPAEKASAPAGEVKSMDVLDQIAAMAPKPALPTPGVSSNIRIYDWKVIDGAPLGNVLTGVTEHRFVRPVAVAVRSENMYVVDQGADTLYRYDLASGRLEALLDLRAEMKGEVDDIYVAKDFSFYLTDTAGARVVHYDRHGDVIQEFHDFYNLVWPVAVTELENGDVVVADGHFDHLLRFNSIGKLIAAYGGRGKGVAEFLNITTMTQGPDGYYVGARVGRRMQVLGLDGGYRYAFDEGAVVFPAAIAVDRNNRSYVADYMDNTIKVFDRGSFIGTIGGYGTMTGRFKRITDLWLDENVLYIVDSLNGRIQAARLAPEPVALPPVPEPQPADLIQETVPEAIEPQPEPVKEAAPAESPQSQPESAKEAPPVEESPQPQEAPPVEESPQPQETSPVEESPQPQETPSPTQ
jgi:hypothetical protein